MAFRDSSGSGSAPNELIGKLYNPFPSIVSFIDLLNKQLSFSLDPKSSANFGSLTASRRNSKPFIVGLIAPDNPVNFIPVERTPANLGGVNAANATNLGNKTVVHPVTNNGPPTKVARQLQTFSTAQLRQALYDAYVQVTGKAPTEATLSILFAQVQCENSCNPGSTVMSAPNFNLGSSHVSYNSGQKVGHYILDNPGFGINPFDAPVEPKFGTYFRATDHEGPEGGHGSVLGRPFDVAFNAFDDLKTGAGFQISIVGQWQGALDAQTPEDYINLIKPIPGPRGPGQPGRAGYFGADPDLYLSAMKGYIDAYKTQFPDPLGTSSPETIGVSDKPPQELQLMSPGTSTDFTESDPQGDRIGRNIQPADAERQAVARLQTDALQAQIDAVQMTPPLILLINPSDFERSYERAYDDSTKGRQQNIPQVWMERPLKIKANGVTAGQYAIGADGGGGLTTHYRIYSLSYANLMSLVMLYKNNGVLRAGDEAERGIPIVSMTVFIYYDEHIYLGSFDDFGIDDAGDKPFNMSYNMTFTSRYDIDLDMSNRVIDAAIVQGLGF